VADRGLAIGLDEVDDPVFVSLKIHQDARHGLDRIGKDKAKTQRLGCGRFR
jgi:hypothetical protein